MIDDIIFHKLNLLLAHHHPVSILENLQIFKWMAQDPTMIFTSLVWTIQPRNSGCMGFNRIEATSLESDICFRIIFWFISHHFSSTHGITFNLPHLYSLLNSFDNPHNIMSIFQCCCTCLRIVGNLSRLLGNLSSAQHHHCRRVESHIISTKGENDDHESPLFPLQFLLNGAANRHL